MASKRKWTKINRTDRMRYELANPQHYPSPDSDAYRSNYALIDWHDGSPTPVSDAASDSGSADAGGGDCGGGDGGGGCGE